MPNNFRHVGLIHLMLPNARIIDARREPMACCFSNFKQLFANGQEFTYSIEDIARYYRTYLELMRHWDQVLPGRVLRVHHEDVVDDLEGSVRRLLEFCGLEFEPQCVAFHETKRSVRTASSEQVRQAISREGLEQWKHFEPWLGPLKDGPRRRAEPLPRTEVARARPQRSVPVRQRPEVQALLRAVRGWLTAAPPSSARRNCSRWLIDRVARLRSNERAAALLDGTPQAGMLVEDPERRAPAPGQGCAAGAAAGGAELLPQDAEAHTNLGAELRQPGAVGGGVGEPAPLARA